MTETYTATARILHWVIAVLFIALVASGVIADNLPRGELRGALFDLHRSLGVTIIPFVILRIVWRFLHKPPAYDPPLTVWMLAAAGATHFALYVLMVTQPASGVLMYLLDNEGIDVFGVLTLPPLPFVLPDMAGLFRTMHEFSAFAIYALTALHIGAALYHALWRKDGVFTRMTRLS